jgi:hypothetical protein
MHSLLGPAGFLEPVPSRSPCEPVRQDTAERPGGLPVLSCHFLDGRDDGIEHPRVAERAGVVEQAVVIDDVVEDRVAGLGDETNPSQALKQQRQGLGYLRVGTFGWQVTSDQIGEGMFPRLAVRVGRS